MRGTAWPAFARIKKIGVRNRIDRRVRMTPRGTEITKMIATVKESAYQLPPERSPGKKLSGDAHTQVKELVRLLRESAQHPAQSRRRQGQAERCRAKTSSATASTLSAAAWELSMFRTAERYPGLQLRRPPTITSIGWRPR